MAKAKGDTRQIRNLDDIQAGTVVADVRGHLYKVRDRNAETITFVYRGFQNKGVNETTVISEVSLREISRDGEGRIDFYKTVRATEARGPNTEAYLGRPIGLRPKSTDIIRGEPDKDYKLRYDEDNAFLEDSGL